MSDGTRCNPPPDDVVVQLVNTLTAEQVNRVSEVPEELALRYKCTDPASGSGCVFGVDRGDEDYQLSRLAMYHEPSNTLILAEGEDGEYVVTRVGFVNKCVSLATARPLHMSSEVDEATLNGIFAAPDSIKRLDNLLEGDGFIATLARDSSVYLQFARDWAGALLDDLSELIRGVAPSKTPESD